MPTADIQLGTGPDKPAPAKPAQREPVYRLTFVESPSIPVSLIKQIFASLREPKITVPREYYRGEANLPVTDARAWYRDLPGQLKTLFEKPRHPIEAHNRRQTERRALLSLGLAVAGAAAGWLLMESELWIALGLGAGYAVGLLLGILLFKKREYPPDIWQDYRMQPASWLNSLLVHAIAIGAMILPFVIGRMATPVKASPKIEITDISPYLNELPGAAKKSGGGGGGGDRTPTPPSKGRVPVMRKMQLAPPMAKIPNVNPQMPVQPSLLGPPDLKLPEMATNMPWGDPQGVAGPPSNGPGSGGGIGTGEGTGIGSGKGGGLGPGEGGGTGGGPFSVGGNVSAPIPIYKPEPPYSEEARKAKYQGTVVLWIVVDAQGNVTDERVVKPLGLGLDEKAIETVKTWKFKPALRNGAPVPVRVMVEVSFRLF
jgi:periplasmic protein TonB